MAFEFKILEKEEIHLIIPLVQKLNANSVSDAILMERFSEMVTQNYECAVIYDGDVLIGVSGLWFCTRHYCGKTVEADHVFIDDAYRGKGLGKQFFNWINNYVKSKGCNAMELNTYVSNYPSHKFYYNEGFNILGYHFLKKF
ncbi:GNAT family N-acetyltransferase [uncultured Algibacter sp.]|uniref:GNAT family N-acetyltransferase n=1 Tax=uncultured Algibacter sp. TaxID=298659 RepID=UPI0032178769